MPSADRGDHEGVHVYAEAHPHRLDGHHLQHHQQQQQHQRNPGRDFSEGDSIRRQPSYIDREVMGAAKGGELKKLTFGNLSTGHLKFGASKST